MKHNQTLKLLISICFLLVTIYGCTKLDSKVYNQTTTFWNTPEQVEAGLAPAYISLRGFANGDIFSLQEVTSDEIIVPTRGSDWYDNGQWQQLWLHTWTSNLGFMNGAWEFIYSGIARINLIKYTVSNLKPIPAGLDTTKVFAELNTLRAFYYYQALDLFGNVPVVTDFNADPASLKNRPRAEVFAFIEHELKTSLPYLNRTVDKSSYGKVTKWFGFALLAKLYLNAQVYTGAPRWNECMVACDSIINANIYGLSNNFFDNFVIENEKSPENIFVIPYDAKRGLNGFNIQMFTLHYQSNETYGLGASPYNGFCSPADFYNLFDSQDKRRDMFLVGQQYDRSGNPLRDKQVNLPLIFDPNIEVISSTDPKFRLVGARSRKYEFTPDTPGDMSNDFVVVRLGDIILIKAEAALRNGAAGDAIATLNRSYGGLQGGGASLRSRAGLAPFAALTLDDMLKERAREMAWEGCRRTDLIRFGKYLDARKPAKQVSGAFRTLFPIPKAQRDKNPSLVQNPGYAE
ncbi:RagB/SusD family nutrient uptake outer membrane protein [Chitinophaga pendula]|uniref:RagB/SusD family nutrient uptake outer membrane protein n=1 Tax=Chitinophaga TaxID=79328 RepID=UPI000BAEE3C2|nr:MULTISPECIES: RagB/SusD family nutrient uptake outer membrane protein [Chitinophaga]ASZ10678.1 RagB/SusD family nutrient uptake outer membrane protein [Chitinophaga sp. MD30]UCJ06347.1 RagB/SusD family nutrient uptake outer membrane protein [Chitinophaga pendula]